MLRVRRAFKKNQVVTDVPAQTANDARLTNVRDRLRSTTCAVKWPPVYYSEGLLT